eukprot:30897-Pelagococcus_subviridis.AAC.2
MHYVFAGSNPAGFRVLEGGSESVPEWSKGTEVCRFVLERSGNFGLAYFRLTASTTCTHPTKALSERQSTTGVTFYCFSRKLDANKVYSNVDLDPATKARAREG